MNNYVNILEIQNRYARLLVGYLLNGELKVTYTKEVKLTVPFKDGDILDAGSLSKDISSLLKIDERDLNFQYDASEIILVLPSYGLEAYVSIKTTHTISKDSQINKLDVQNVFSLIEKERSNDNSSIVNIVPYGFYTEENNRMFVRAPIGNISSFLTLKAYCYALPTKMIKDLQKCVNNAGFKIKNVLISSLCFNQVIKNSKSKYKNAIFVYFSDENTFISLSNENFVINTINFGVGYVSLVSKMMNELKISEETAKKLLFEFGFDDSTNTYNPLLVNDDVIREAKINKNKLNAYMLDFFKDWKIRLNNAIVTLLGEHAEFVDKLPILCVGKGFSKINGFKDFLTREFATNTCEFLRSNIVGVSYDEYIDLIGAFYLDEELSLNFKDNGAETRVEVSLTKGV